MLSVLSYAHLWYLGGKYFDFVVEINFVQERSHSLIVSCGDPGYGLTAVYQINGLLNFFGFVGGIGKPANVHIGCEALALTEAPTETALYISQV